jgi:hypothetical protein
MEPLSSDEIFDSVQWSTFQGRYLLLPQATLGGALLAGLILRLYFGITGCIIPIIYVEAFEPNVITFTLAGPYDADGKKEMYLLAHTGEVDEVKLYRYSCGYSSIAEFYARPKVHLIPIAPVHGGKKALMAEYKKIGLPWY